MQNKFGDIMKKFVKFVNITSAVISAITLLTVVILVAVFSSSKDVEFEETTLVIEQMEVTRRKTKDNVSFYAENVNRNVKYYIVVAFELYDMEGQSVYFTVNDKESVCLITVNENQEASVVYY